MALPASVFALNDALLEAAEREKAQDLSRALQQAGSGDRDPLGVGRVILTLAQLYAES